MNRHLTEMFPDNYSAKVADTPIGMAHIAGTGPAGTTCSGCEHYWPREIKNPVTKHGTCRKYSRLMRDERRVGKIKPGTPSCRYFEVKTP